MLTRKKKQHGDQEEKMLTRKKKSDMHSVLQANQL
jgi:hypothetical protein